MRILFSWGSRGGGEKEEGRTIRVWELQKNYEFTGEVTGRVSYNMLTNLGQKQY